MKLFAHESTRTKKEWKGFLQERKVGQAPAAAGAQEPPAQDYQKGEKLRALAKRFLGIFQSKMKEIRAEGRFGEGKAKTLYVPGKSRRASHEEQTELQDVRTQRHNDCITVQELRIAKDGRTARQAVKNRFDSSFQTFIGALGEEEAQAVQAQREEYALLQEWIQEEDAQQTMQTYRNAGEGRNNLMSKMIDEVSGYNFSLAMLNKTWLEHNQSTMLSMIWRAKSLHSLLERNQDYRQSLSPQIRQLLDIKAGEADSLLSAFTLDLDKQGIRLNAADGTYEVLQRTRAERLADEREDTGRKDFAAWKKKELALGRDLTEEDGDSETAIANLTYEDFAAMTGTKNRGQVELSGSKLKIVNNGKFCSKKGTASAQNRLIRIRFMETALAQLSEKDQAAYRPQLLAVLGLYNPDQTESMPLSRKLIASVLSEVNHLRSRVNRALAAQDAEREKSAYKIAEKVNALLPGYIGELAQNKAEKSAAKERIKRILSRAKQLGVPGSSLSEHQMDNILDRNLDLLRDKIFESLQGLDSMVLNLKGGQDAALDWLENQDLVTKVAALEIRRMAQLTDNRPALAEYQLGEYLVDQAFSLSGKEQVKPQFEALYVGELAKDGDFGLFELIESRKNLIAPAAYENGTARSEAEELAMLCDRLQRINMITQKWLLRSDAEYDVDAQELAALGQMVDQALLDQGKFGNILPALQGTRFLAGYRAAANKIQGGFRFENAARDLAVNMRRERVVRQDVVLAEQPLAQEAHPMDLSAEDQAVLEQFSPQQKDLVNVFLLKSPASSLIKQNEDDVSKSILQLHKTLRQYKANDHFIITVFVGEAQLRLEQKPTGVLVASDGNKKISLPLNGKRLADELETDMAASIEKYGVKSVLPLFPTEQSMKDEDDRLDHEYRVMRQREMDEARANNRQPNIRGSQEFYRENISKRFDWELVEAARERSLCHHILEKYTGKKAAFFANIPIRTLKDYTHQILEARPEELEERKQGIIADVAEKDSKVLYNDVDVLKNITADEEFQRGRRINGVYLAPDVKQAPEENEPVWSKEEERVKNFIADVVFMNASWHLDSEYKKRQEGEAHRGNRLRAALASHPRAVILIMDDRTILDRTIDRMAFPGEDEDGGNAESPLKRSIKEDMQQLFNDPGLQQVRRKRERGASEEETLVDMYRYFNDKKNSGGIDTLEDKINADVAQVVTDMQRELATATDELFQHQAAGGGNIPAEFPDPYERHITRAEQLRRIELRQKELARRIEAENNSDVGQGQFTKNVLKKYFAASSPEDQRAMVGAMLRFSVPKKDMSQMNAQQKQEEKDRRKGSSLAGFLKGAGPLMQKILQGLPEQGMPAAMKKALADMKSGLMPIPDAVVRMRLELLVRRSNGDVKEIRMERSLGAASVGQAFLCRIFGPSYPPEGKEVVIKLLRPDVRNRMIRDKQIILNCANEVDPSGAMATTYENQTKKIEEEFDLTIEDRNLRIGELYNKGDAHVRSVGAERALAATTNILVLEKASGKTVDSYMKDVEAARKKAKNRQDLQKILEQLELRQKHIAMVADKWVSEGIFGSGFYHGDLHAGNIMVDDNGATIIDYGNAVQLTEFQQLQITRLTAAAAVGKQEDFIDAFHNLLEDTTEEQWNQKKDAFAEEVRKVFEVGAKEVSGQMISLILMRAQTVGLEVPAAINSFSQSQIRLQNTVDGMNATINAIRQDIDAMDHQVIEKPLMDLALLCQHDYVSSNKDQDQTLREYGQKFFPDRNTLFCEMRKKGKSARRSFNRKWVNNLQEGPEKQALLQALQNLRQAQDQNRGDLAEKERAVANAYQEAFVQSRNALPEVQELRQNLFSQNPETMQKIDAELESWFSDTENFGNELRDLYKSFRTAVENGAPEAEQNATADLFFKQYFEAAEVRFAAIRRQRRSSAVPVRSFFDVMAGVTEAHLSASLQRLGIATSVEYQKILSKRRLAKANPGAVQQAQGPVEVDDAQLAGVRMNLGNLEAGNLPDSLSKARKRRQRMDEFGQRVREMEDTAAKLYRENGVYVKNDLEHEAEVVEGQPPIQETKPMDVWHAILAEQVENKSWQTSQEELLQAGGQQIEHPFYQGIFQQLTQALEADYALTTDEQREPVLRFEAEQNLHRLLVDLPRENGGSAFFVKVMEGEAKEGGQLARFGILQQSLDGQHTSKTIEFLSGLENLQEEEQKQAREVVASLLRLFGEKVEKSYLAREGIYDENVREKNHQERVLVGLREDRLLGSQEYLWYIEKETQHSELPDEYQGEEGRQAYVRRLQENGWLTTEDAQFFTSLHQWITGEKDNAAVPQKRAKIQTLMKDLLQIQIKTDDMRLNWTHAIESLVSDYTEAPMYDDVSGKLESSKRSIRGNLGFFRYKTKNPDLVGEHRSQAANEMGYFAKRINNWPANDEDVINSFGRLLENAYIAANVGETEEARNKGKALVEKLEPIAHRFECEMLESKEMRSEILGQIIAIYEGEEMIYDVRIQVFGYARSRYLQQEDYNAIEYGAREAAEKRRAEEEERRRREEAEEKERRRREEAEEKERRRREEEEEKERRRREEEEEKERRRLEAEQEENDDDIEDEIIEDDEELEELQGKRRKKMKHYDIEDEDEPKNKIEIKEDKKEDNPWAEDEDEDE